jgi:hypothetical protein
MFGVVSYQDWTTDQLEQELLADEAERSRLAAKDLAILEELDGRQVATGDGCRSLSEWTASRLDVSRETAKSLVRTMRRTIDRPDLRAELVSGEVSFDRVEALSRILVDVGLCEHTFPECAGRQRYEPGSAQKPNIGPPPTSISSSNHPWTSRGGDCGEDSTGIQEPSSTRH